MATDAPRKTSLAHDSEGSGVPVVFLHGLTFDRRTWRPILDRLSGSVRSIVVDLPAHGESGGDPAPLDAVADQVYELVASLGAERPIVVGHSMSGGIVGFYANAHPTRGLVTIDNGPEVRPFGELVHQLEPALRGQGFSSTWQMFESSLGLERIPEPARSLVMETHHVSQSVVLGYWEMPLNMDPSELQAMVDAQLARIAVPLLAVFGRPVTEGERERFERMPDVQVEEWVGAGHFVHLVEPDRFTTRLRKFIDDCGDA
jgi:pimeloyl-ACP methyl ester carboxylesterase